MQLEQKVGQLLKERGLTLGVVESATGGLVSHLITNIAGSSAYYKGSITAYSNEVKINLVGVKAVTLAKHGAVSPQVAKEMAAGGRRALGVDICLADTGIAGPEGGTDAKPVGLFYIGLSCHGEKASRQHIFEGNRQENKQQAASAVLEWLFEHLSADVVPSNEPKRVVTCFLEKDGRILLLRRSQKVGTYRGWWAAVSGYMEEAPPEEQARTEISEEIGLGDDELELVRQAEPLEVEDKEIGAHWLVYPYLFRLKKGAEIRLDWEHDEAMWVTPEDMKNHRVVPGLATVMASVYPF